MNEMTDAKEKWSAIEQLLRDQSAEGFIGITLHAHQEMVQDAISMDELEAALSNAKILENYPEH